MELYHWGNKEVLLLIMSDPKQEWQCMKSCNKFWFLGTYVKKLVLCYFLCSWCWIQYLCDWYWTFDIVYVSTISHSSWQFRCTHDLDATKVALSSISTYNTIFVLDRGYNQVSSFHYINVAPAHLTCNFEVLKILGYSLIYCLYSLWVFENTSGVFVVT